MDNVNGLTTPALTDGEFSSGAKHSDRRDDASSVLQRMQDLEARAGAVLASLEEGDSEMAAKWATISDKLAALEQEFSS